MYAPYEFFTTLTEAKDAIQMITSFLHESDIVSATQTFSELKRDLEPCAYMWGDD